VGVAVNLPPRVPNVFTFTIASTVNKVVGECKSDIDCLGNSNGFICAMMYNNVTKCVRCLTDCECPMQHYCHRDASLCKDPLTADLVPCDPASAALAGTCQPKDPNSNIFGARCLYNGAGVNGYSQGFCGAVTYMPANWTNVWAANTTHYTKWSGDCTTDGICRECNEGDTACSKSRVCVNGLYVRNSGNSQYGNSQAALSETTRQVGASSTVSNVMATVLFFVIAIWITILVAIILSLCVKGFGGHKVNPSNSP